MDRSREDAAPEEPAGAGKEDRCRTPGDGTLDGSTPAGLTVEELRERARESDGKGEPGTG